MQSHATTFIKIGHANKFLKNFHERLAMREEFWNEENDGGEISRTVEIGENSNDRGRGRTYIYQGQENAFYHPVFHYIS